MSSLDVWLDGVHIATITQRRGRMALQYLPGVAPLGQPVISVAMPMSANRYPDKVVRSFFRGLLPEGAARLMIAHDFGLDANDDMGLLAALGRDCAGALVVLPPDQTPGSIDEENELAFLSEAEIEFQIRSLPVHPLGVTGKVRASLPGVQPKLLLAKVNDRWCSPNAGHPSTHILKPGIPELPNSVANEAFCLNLAARVGLRAAETSVARFGSTEVLVSKRYDRLTEHGDRIVRLHQEDSCQALSILVTVPKQKYEAFGGPSLRRIAGALVQGGGSLTELLQQVTFTVIVGNADLHGKNISFLHDRRGRVTLAPLYDVMCTTHYDGQDNSRDVDTELGLFIGQQREILAVTGDDLVAEAASWGMAPAIARSTINDLAAVIADGIDATLSTTDFDVSSRIVDRICARAAELR